MNWKKLLIKNPWIAAVLNLLIPGLGYLYIGRKKLFGSLMVLGVVCFAIWSGQYPMLRGIFANIWINISTLFIMVGFAIDGYQECKQIRSDFPPGGWNSLTPREK